MSLDVTLRIKTVDVTMTSSTKLHRLLYDSTLSITDFVLVLPERGMVRKGRKGTVDNRMLEG